MQADGQRQCESLALADFSPGRRADGRASGQMARNVSGMRRDRPGHRGRSRERARSRHKHCLLRQEVKPRPLNHSPIFFALQLHFFFNLRFVQASPVEPVHDHKPAGLRLPANRRGERRHQRVLGLQRQEQQPSRLHWAHGLHSGKKMASCVELRKNPTTYYRMYYCTPSIRFLSSRAGS